MVSRFAMYTIESRESAEFRDKGWDLETLVAVASRVQVNASVPLSRFRVGAAVVTRNGKIFEGCNTESLIPVLGVCAERNAINHAVIHGESDFLAIAVVSDLNTPLLPCGTCLQYLQEFGRQYDRDILVVAQGRSGDRVVSSVNELFKGGFAPETGVKEIQESLRWSNDDAEKQYVVP
ncbi:MAG: cytidine deaminase [Thermodesulfobacteriota bacterium]|nr:cytidine deaminase [Thermodesulfobacteriota bacterium]